MTVLSMSYKDYDGCYDDIVTTRVKETTIRPFMRPLKGQGLEYARKKIKRFTGTIDNPKRKLQIYYKLRCPKVKGGSRLICERDQISSLYFIRFAPQIDGSSPVMFSQKINGDIWYLMEEEQLDRLAKKDGFDSIHDFLMWFHATYKKELMTIIFGVIGL